MPSDPQSPILTALYTRKPEEAERLARGAQLTIWEASALGRDARIAELLGADPALANAWAPDGFSPLALAAFFGHATAARLLLDGGADPSAAARNEMRVQPLHAAAAARAAAITRLLLERGADPNARQQAGYTALMEWARGGHEEMVRLLLEAGADPALTSDDGQTAARLARAAGHAALADRLDATPASAG